MDTVDTRNVPVSGPPPLRAFAALRGMVPNGVRVTAVEMGFARRREGAKRPPKTAHAEPVEASSYSARNFGSRRHPELGSGSISQQGKAGLA